MHIVCTEISAKTRRKTTISTASGERGILDRFLSNSRILLKKKNPHSHDFSFRDTKGSKIQEGRKNRFANNYHKNFVTGKTVYKKNHCKRNIYMGNFIFQSTNFEIRSRIEENGKKNSRDKIYFLKIQISQIVQKIMDDENERYRMEKYFFFTHIPLDADISTIFVSSRFLIRDFFDDKRSHVSNRKLRIQFYPTICPILSSRYTLLVEEAKLLLSPPSLSLIDSEVERNSPSLGKYGKKALVSEMKSLEFQST